MGTLLSSPCQLRLGVDLSCLGQGLTIVVPPTVIMAKREEIVVVKGRKICCTPSLCSKSKEKN